MKYIVITDNAGMFEFTLGQLVATAGNLVCHDAAGQVRTLKGTKIIALMEAGYAEVYEAKLAELEQLKNRNGHQPPHQL